jgi:hypothetical protein
MVSLVVKRVSPGPHARVTGTTAAALQVLLLLLLLLLLLED